jgi:large subunit ribosomal protein L24
MTKAKVKIKKGDTVVVLTGNDKGKSGKVITVNREKSRVLVEGVNFKTKHVKPSAQETEGRIDKMEAPVHISNVALSVNGKATKVGRRLEEEKIVRYAKSTGETV